MAIPVLQALDQAKTQSYHFKTIIIAGMGFLTDAYDLVVIGILTKLLGRIYYYDPSYLTSKGKHNVGTLPININAAVIGVAFCGTLLGQLFFGWAGDHYGRKNVYGLTLLLMVIASIGQGLSFGDSPASVIATLCFFRFWLGFGIGGDYPLSATIMAEYSNKKTRGAFVAAVFAMQGVGYLAAGIVTIVVTAIFMNSNPRPHFDDSSIANYPNYSTPSAADWVWRIVLMFGAVPALLTFYSRSQMPETARYTALIEKNQAQAALDMERILESQISGVEFPMAAKTQAKSHEFGLFTRQFARRHGLQLFGTCMTWFLLDISYYSQQLFQSNVFTAAGWLPPAQNMSALEETFRIAKWQTLLALFSTIPGYWFTVALVDRVGRKPIALMGFFFMSLFMYILAFGWHSYQKHSNERYFIVFYGLTFFFSNFGPNATTFIIPAELYPARLRSTCHGISAAAGKAGAIVGGFGFLYASADAHNFRHPPNKYLYPRGIGFKDSFILLASCSVVGFIVQFLCVPETMGRSLEDLSGEDADNAIAGEENKSQEAL